MAKLPRIIIPNTPHHVTQRGNRRQQTFFCDRDYHYYLKNLFELGEVYGVRIDAYCLMPNHVHLILTPPDRDSLIKMVGELHQRYTRYINFLNNWRGHFWQGRFFSVPLSPEYYSNCVRYVEQNPIRAGLTQDPCDYPWRSRNSEWQDVLCYEHVETIRAMSRTGRPCGSEDFLDLVLDATGFDPRPRKAGRKPGNKTPLTANA